MPSNMLFAPKEKKEEIKKITPASSSMNQKSEQITEGASESSEIVNPREFLQLFAATRGYVTGSGMPDESKSAKIIIRDFVTGKIPYYDLEERFKEIKEKAYLETINKLEDMSEHYMPIKNVRMMDLLVNEKTQIDACAI